LTPISLTATAFYFKDTSILAEVAALLGRKDDAKMYRQLAGQIRAAFNRAFYNSATHQYATGSQCANSMALVMGLAAPADRRPVLDAVVADVRAHGNSLTAGDVGYGYLLRALAEGGRSDVIFAMNNQSDKPGYGYQLKMGATSLTESWSARRANSQNHFMLGQIMEWFYHEIGGIGCDPAGPGFRKIIIAPQLVGDLTWAKTSYDSIHGRITTEWNREGAKLRLRVGIPPNTTATVLIPTKSAADVTESGHAANRSAGVKFLRMEQGRAVCAVVSGDYDFGSSIPP
jgi:alpha-L-rhamnosidase